MPALTNQNNKSNNNSNRIMHTEEDYIRQQAGKKDPFKVPEGYFDHLTENIMSRLPEQSDHPVEEHPGFVARIKPWLYMAAMFVAILLSLRYVMEHTTDPSATEPVQSTNEYVEMAILDHAVMDDYTLYQDLTEDYLEEPFTEEEEEQ